MGFKDFCGALLVAGALAGAAPAQAQSAGDAIKARQDQMKAMGGDFRIINEALKTPAPDAAAIAAAGARIDAAIKNTNDLYPAGSGPESGLKTRAMAEVWSQNAEFRRLGEASIAEAATFSRTAAGGDIAAVRAGFKALTDSCVACHAKFRAEEKK